MTFIATLREYENNDDTDGTLVEVYTFDNLNAALIEANNMLRLAVAEYDLPWKIAGGLVATLPEEYDGYSLVAKVIHK